MFEAGTGVFAALHWLLAFERELLAFAAFWFCLGLADEFALDLAWLWLRLTGRAQTRRLRPGYGKGPLTGPAARRACRRSAARTALVGRWLAVAAPRRQRL